MPPFSAWSSSACRCYDNVRYVPRQFVLASALLAACFVLGGESQARAGYISTAGLNSPSAVPFASQPFSADPWEREDGMCTALNRTEDRSQNELNQEPAGSPAPFTKLFHTAWHIEFDGGAGSSTGSSSVDGPSSQQVGEGSRVDFTLINAVFLLPPETGEAHPFSLASSLFRPPRSL
jgi:hypothetical protein